MRNVEIPKWLERLPLAPEFRPTDTEFADPIAYISKIEKEASAFGICKVIPPLPKPSRKYVLHNLNKSLSKCPELGLDANLVASSKTDSSRRDSCDGTANGGESRAVFTTRHQELGCEKGKKVKGVGGDQVVGAQKQVWQSGGVYTLEQFEAKSKNFAKSLLGMVKDVNPLVVEAMFWKAASEKPIYVEYANDVPGSGFGEPEGLLRYFDRRRRRRRRKRNSFDRNNIGGSESKNDLVDTVNTSTGNKGSGSQSNPNFCTETASNSLQSGQSHHDASFPGRKDFQCSGEMEGTAGWKLSNSPWNLQVIARSPGSLTRFMPDDIPGVTSPMVYIGMLFSWFAWHVEDHELHSLNFLHIGSPKTWYSVPGDYAFNFEEAIRVHGYGGNADRLVALSRLGEKTTVLSPEIIVASGIPCCRLVQNPGEFVVTFPRAYHIGFSHGFNCGEAANFGTPKWLTIAKEAAVRRAAMNYLPMLSHQQLLYLLTMSFISRIPRSLLPGVRSSRLRDRQKEERELLVKRAFIEDILHENNLLTVLLQRSSSYHVVLWDVDSLPSSSRESECYKDTDAAMLTSTVKDSPENDDNNNIQEANTSTRKDSPESDDTNIHDASQLNKYISAIGFDLNDDDLAYDFQIESGTLPCVACGILGFPFMAVVQPSEVASLDLLPKGPCTVSHPSNVADGSTKETSLVVETSQSTHSTVEQSSASDHSLSLKHDAVSSKVDNAKGWNISTVFLKPRVFCLEHAIEIEQLLSLKGGANVLVICHSDFQKIKTHAAVLAEEIAVSFCYTEIPLDGASPEDLNLIDIAIEREEQVDCAEDWTSQLSINLQHCVKVKRSSPSKNVQHLWSLGGLFCGPTPISKAASGVNWLSRKLRSKRHLKQQLLQSKPSGGTGILDEDMKTNKENRRAKKDVKIIQYSRKRYKAHTSAGTQAHDNRVVQDSLDTQPEDQDNEDKNTSGILIRVENNIKSLSEPSKLASETVGSTPDEHVIHSAAENETLREDEKMIESSKTCDGLTESNSETRSSVHSDGDDVTEEVSRHGESSNCSDDDPHIMDSEPEVSKSSSSEEQHSVQTEGDKQENIVSRCTAPFESTVKTGSKRKRELRGLQLEDRLCVGGFIKSPCEGLRPRAGEDVSVRQTNNRKPIEERTAVKKLKKATNQSVPQKDKRKKGQKGRHYKCELDGCTMSFHTKAELVLHKGNRCPVEGCRKKFNSHKYAIQHQRVHDDDRPLKCPWDGCTMSFKWAWARTEHLRVHTGERPYACKVKGCGLTFRFVSDFSRHRRKTGHYAGRTA